MKKSFVINLSILLMILFHLGKAQLQNSISSGLCIEVGGGHNTLFWSSHGNIKTPGGVSVDRTDLYLTLNMRINYLLKLFESGYLLPFIGYNRFGGNGKGDKYSFDTIEFGSILIYNISKLGLGIGGKINRHLKVEYKYSSMKKDRSDWFTTW